MFSILFSIYLNPVKIFHICLSQYLMSLQGWLCSLLFLLTPVTSYFFRYFAIFDLSSILPEYYLWKISKAWPYGLSLQKGFVFASAWHEAWYFLAHCEFGPQSPCGLVFGHEFQRQTFSGLLRVKTEIHLIMLGNFGRFLFNAKNYQMPSLAQVPGFVSKDQMSKCLGPAPASGGEILAFAYVSELVLQDSTFLSELSLLPQKPSYVPKEL